MRTRRSPRNQAILWRALGGAPAPQPAKAKPTPAEVVATLEAALAGFLPRSARMQLQRELAKARLRGAVRAKMAEEADA